MNNRTLISVVIPAYNHSYLLKKTLESVINQTYRNLEIIVVDDGSKIDLLSVIEEINDSRISYYKLEHKNANVARNFGINKTKGKYIAMLDSDDEWLANHIEDSLNTLLKEEVDGIYGSLIIKNKENYTPIPVRKLNDNELMVNYLLSTGYGAQTSTLFMTSNSARCILWDPDLNRHQDYDFVVRYNEKFKLAPKITPTVIYRITNSATKIDFESCIKFIEKNKKDIDPAIYKVYNSNMCKLAKQLRVSQYIVNHYERESSIYL